MLGVTPAADSFAAGEEEANAAVLRQIIERLDSAEQKVQSLHGELEAARQDVQSLRQQLDAMRSSAKAAPIDPANDSPAPSPAPVTMPQPDRATLDAGRTAFLARCTQCHEAARPLEQSLSLDEWRLTVRRMARKRGADIHVSEFEPIAQYLATRTAPSRPPIEPATAAETLPPDNAIDQGGIFGGRLSLDATIAPVFRLGTESNDDLENDGFFAHLWVGAEWNAPGNPVSARVQACFTCHDEGDPGSRVELVEGTVTFSLHELFQSMMPVEAKVSAGRFVVPFGGHADQSHPGAYRTVTRPLLYNMGELVNRFDIGPAVLPMPYSDEGALVTVRLPLDEGASMSEAFFSGMTVTLDGYIVNGLQGSSGEISFFESRDYVDNNSEAAYGGRVTVGNRHVRAGGSFMAGQYNETPGGGGPLDERLEYEMWAADLSLRWQDVLRIQAEYAVRNNDRLVFLPGEPISDDEVRGWMVEGEVRLLERPRLGLLARFDRLERDSDLPPTGSALLTGRFDVDRFTWGFNLTLPGGSLLMINHEHWFMPNGLEDVDVVGFRWVVTFSGP